MDKRYQVFVSSTYVDLVEERQKVTQTLMGMDCIPAGMELFPAADEEQFEFIKKVIDDCDYYLLIVGARYGSLSEEGISYTEMEYNYAKEKGIKVIALIHGSPDDLPTNKTDKNPELALKLEQFKDNVKTGRMVKFWKSSEELPGLVALSLISTMKMFPAIGWIRANQAGSIELLNEINILRKENENLKQQVRPLELAFDASKLVSMHNIVELDGTYYSLQHGNTTWKKSFTWNEVFSVISPYLLEWQNDLSVKLAIRKFCISSLPNIQNPTLNDLSFQKLKVQFLAYGLIEIKTLNTRDGKTALFWHLTNSGKQKMFELNTIKQNVADE